VRQGTKDDTQAFTDRFQTLEQKITCKVNESLAQQTHRDNNELMLLASFVPGLGGTPGKRMYCPPHIFENVGGLEHLIPYDTELAGSYEV